MAEDIEEAIVPTRTTDLESDLCDSGPIFEIEER
jgi:hypothetical protein